MLDLNNPIVDAARGTIMKRLKWTWLGYGAAAYVGLRVMRKFGILEPQADRAIRFIEKTSGLSRFMSSSTSGSGAQSGAQVSVSH